MLPSEILAYLNHIGEDRLGAILEAMTNRYAEIVDSGYKPIDALADVVMDLKDGNDYWGFNNVKAN
jgi:hypothetical protein